ncbi:uncharacterized protein LY89DRAFT_502071 [Mollisia scopiformis]|uniref:Uncharacterized protein n=1 Tax=Mollisia scopiformis TaxID=149040 RepID=A0A194XES7_MOLSC|nr:uncharacterized protein LY89DRAFT_502071 [Mollisia scopiformis]KUJ18678.1 hypothetical protein LY89DRAFT_502071 [Mollisia scopiformis]
METCLFTSWRARIARCHGMGDRRLTARVELEFRHHQLRWNISLFYSKLEHLKASFLHSFHLPTHTLSSHFHFPSLIISSPSDSNRCPAITLPVKSPLPCMQQQSPRLVSAPSKQLQKRNPGRNLTTHSLPFKSRPGQGSFFPRTPPTELYQRR